VGIQPTYVDPAAVIGKLDTEVFPPEDAARLIVLKRKALETETEVREQFWLTSGGQRVFLDLFLEPMRDAPVKSPALESPPWT